MNRHDVAAGALAGFLIGLLGAVALENLAVQLGALRWILAFVLPPFVVAGLFVAAWLTKLWQPAWQVAKFLVTGILNTFVDVGVLNFAIFLTGIASGAWFSAFKGLSFTVAVTNSFFWNKFWTFGKKGTVDAGGEFMKFVVVSLLVFFVNVGVASLIVNVLGPQWGVEPKVWANIGAIVAGFVGFAGNFLGYKFLVFK
ncbi:MAG: GtrA family protein [Parcubacteria group bacterium]|nr:GtrA family protein [Parcubacteria group bacterium]